MASGPNPILLVRDHIPEHVADLRDRLAKALAQVREIQTELTTAEMLLAVTQEEPKNAPRNEERAPRRTGKEPNEPALPNP